MTGLLLRASLEGAVFALVVLVACRAMPRLSPSVRTALWWCVAAKFVVTLFAVAPIAVPVLPAADAGTTPSSASATVAARDVAVDAPPLVLPATPAAQSPSIEWTAAAGYSMLVLWLAGLAIAVARMLRDWHHTRGIVRASVAAHESMHSTVRELASLLGVRTVPDVRLSHQVESPMVTGIRHPTILVPAARFPALSPEQQRMALCHELAHMRRGDLWLGVVPAVAERLFFFHPLARLAAREYAFWREAACDERVIVALGASPQSYGRLLLALGVSRHTATFSAAGAAWSFLNLKRRIAMLGHPSSSARVRATAAVVTSLAMLAVMPVKAVARDAQQVRPASPLQPTRAPATATARAAAPRSEATVVPSRAVAAAAATPVAAARATSSPTSPLAAVAAASPPAAATAAATATPAATATATAARAATPVAAAVASAPASAYAYAYGTQEEVSFVYFKDSNSQTMSGSSADMRRAREHRRGDEPLLWFQRRGREYIVRDRDVLRDVEELWAPVSEIGEQQGRIGAQQGVIGMRQGQYGARQGEIGAAQGVVGAKQGVVAAQLGVLAAREARGLTSSERRDIEREREKLREDMRELDREMTELGRRMRQVDPPQDLGRDMESLGREMSTLGRRMERASREANEGMRTLIERAVRDGTAQQVR